MNHLLIWLIFSPILLAATTHFIEKYLTRLGFLIFLIFSALNGLISIFLFQQVSGAETIIYNVGNWSFQQGIVLVADKLSLFILVLIQTLFFFSLLFSRGYIKRDHINFFILFYLLQAGLTGMVLTIDLFNMYVFLEVASIVSYALVAYEKDDQGLEAGFKYLVIGSLGSIIIIWGIGIIYATTASLNLTIIANLFAETAPVIRGTIFILFLVGFGTKFALFPFHPWLPDAHASSPSPISALLSGVMVKVQIFCFLRIVTALYNINYITNLKFNLVVMVLGIGSVLIGHLLALKQEDLKRMLAYSSIAHIGYIVIGLSCLSQQSLIGAFYHILNHSFLKAGLFFFAGVLIYYLNIREISELRGLFWRNPLLSICFCFLALGMIGVPPTNGFASKWLLVLGASSVGQFIPAAVISLGSFISLIYYLRVIIKIFSPAKAEEGSFKVHPLFFIPVGAMAVLSFTLFLFGNQIYAMLNQLVDLL